MSSRYSKSVYKELVGDEEPVDFDFFEDDASEKRENPSNKQPLLTSTPGKHTSASNSYSPRSTDLESARSAASSRSSLNVRLPSASPSRDDVVSSDESDDGHDNNYRSKSKNSDLPIPNSNVKSSNGPTIRTRPKTCKPGSRSRVTEAPITKTGDKSSSSDSESYSSSFTSDSSYSTGNGSSSSGSDSDTDSGSVTDVSPLQSPNSPDNLKNFPDIDERVQSERPKTSKNTRLNSRERHHSEGSAKKSKKENVRFAGVKNQNGRKAPSGPRWNESEAQELSMLLKAVLEMEEAPKTFVQIPGRQHSRPSSAKSTASNASVKSLPNKRMNMSFSNDRVRQIDHENQRLLQQIMSKSGVEFGNATRGKTKPKKVVASQRVSTANGTHRPVMSHAAMRRQREQRRIEIENMQILKRIDGAKPSRDVMKEALMDDHYKLTRYSQQVSKSPLRPSSAKSTSGKQSMSEAASLLSLYSTDSASSKAGSRSSSRPTSAKNSGFRPSTRQTKQAWDDHWQSSTRETR